MLLNHVFGCLHITKKYDYSDIKKILAREQKGDAEMKKLVAAGFILFLMSLYIVVGGGV